MCNLDVINPVVAVSLVVSFVVDLHDDGREQVLKLLSDHHGDIKIPTSVANVVVVTIITDIAVVCIASTASPTSACIHPSAPWCRTTSANATSHHYWRHYLYAKR
uniref:Uncharacterized protein n=1 Tax=Tanacetum cinerariifolium TaxID=118510 RepID=A0A699HWT1_TANCI|nr:hypothetical protein [Tanacetum cinerariifolium]